MRTKADELYALCVKLAKVSDPFELSTEEVAKKIKCHFGYVKRARAELTRGNRIFKISDGVKGRPAKYSLHPPVEATIAPLDRSELAPVISGDDIQEVTL